MFKILIVVPDHKFPFVRQPKTSDQNAHFCVTIQRTDGMQVPVPDICGSLRRRHNKIDYRTPVLQRVTRRAFCEQFNTVIECLLLETITHFLYTPLVSCK